MPRRAAIITLPTLRPSLSGDFSRTCVHSRVKYALLRPWYSGRLCIALRMAVEARIILLQPHCAMGHFRNSGTISLFDTLFKLLRISYSKNLVSGILGFYTECRVRKYLHVYISGNRIMISSNDASDSTCITLHTPPRLILGYRCRTCIPTCYNRFRVPHRRSKACRQRCGKSIGSLRFGRLFQAGKLIAEFVKDCITDLFCIFMALCKHPSLKIVI
jgi:hypothetical protein